MSIFIVYHIIPYFFPLQAKLSQLVSSSSSSTTIYTRVACVWLRLVVVVVKSVVCFYSSCSPETDVMWWWCVKVKDLQLTSLCKLVLVLRTWSLVDYPFSPCWVLVVVWHTRSWSLVLFKRVDFSQSINILSVMTLQFSHLISETDIV